MHSDTPIRVRMVTTSRDKLDCVGAALREYGWEVEGAELSIPEVQSLDPMVVVRSKLAFAADRMDGAALLVDDAALEIPALDGFPGALVGPLLDRGGMSLLERMLRGNGNGNGGEGVYAAAIVCAVGLRVDGVDHFGVGRLEGALDLRSDVSRRTRRLDDVFVPAFADRCLARLRAEQPLVAVHQQRADAVRAAVSSALRPPP